MNKNITLDNHSIALVKSEEDRMSSYCWIMNRMLVVKCPSGGIQAWKTICLRSNSSIAKAKAGNVCLCKSVGTELVSMSCHNIVIMFCLGSGTKTTWEDRALAWSSCFVPTSYQKYNFTVTTDTAGNCPSACLKISSAVVLTSVEAKPPTESRAWQPSRL